MSISYSRINYDFPPDSTESESEFNQRQYEKMIKTADKYFSEKKYDKAESLYKRAIKFQPNYDNTYPEQQLAKIKSIKNQIYIAKYDRTFTEGMTEFKINVKANNYGDIHSYTLVRVIVLDGKADVYEKTVTKYATTYTKNGTPITKYQWSDDTNNPKIKRN